MHHVGPAYHISPHIIVLFTHVPETLKSTWMGQNGWQNFSWTGQPFILEAFLRISTCNEKYC